MSPRETLDAKNLPVELQRNLRIAVKEGIARGNLNYLRQK